MSETAQKTLANNIYAYGLPNSTWAGTTGFPNTEMTLQDLITRALKRSNTDSNTLLRYTQGLDDSGHWTCLISRSFDLDLSDSWVW